MSLVLSQSNVTFDTLRIGTDSTQPTILILPGIQDNPCALGRYINPRFTVIACHYPAQRFRAHEVVQDIISHVYQKLPNVVLIGMSLGGLIAARAAAVLAAHHVGVRLVLWNAPRDASDVIDLTKLSDNKRKAVRFLSKRLRDSYWINRFSRIAFKSLKSEEPLETDADLRDIAADHTYGQSKLLSAYLGGIYTFFEAADWVLDGLQLLEYAPVYVRSSGDQVVRRAAFEAWRARDISRLRLYETVGPHCATSRAPKTTEFDLESALGILGL